MIRRFLLVIGVFFFRRIAVVLCIIDSIGGLFRVFASRLLNAAVVLRFDMCNE